MCHFFNTINAPSNSLMDSSTSLKVNNEKRRSWGTFPSSQHFGGRGACWNSGMGVGGLMNSLIIHTNLHKLNNKLVSV